MSGDLSINLSAIVHNFNTLNAASNGKASAVVKANAYGLGAIEVTRALVDHCETFFVATPREALEIAEIAQGRVIYELSGTSVFQDMPTHIRPVINTDAQLQALGSQEYALQFNSGMNRLGLDDVPEVTRAPSLIMSHLACADDPRHPQNGLQLMRFRRLAGNFPDVPKSLGATDSIALGEAFHFDMVRCGIGLYGGRVFDGNADVIKARLPIIQVRELDVGEPVGYGATYVTKRKTRVATLMGGYADGIFRALSGRAKLSYEGVACPQIGRVSMDTIMVDISALEDAPEALDLISNNAELIALAESANTIPYEILTSLGERYARNYVR